MTVVLVILASIALFWVFGSYDFALNMTIFWVSFAALEGVNVLMSGKTITKKFREWAETQPRWKVWLVTGSITAVGFYFTMHLAMGW